MKSYIQNYLQIKYANWLIKGVFNTIDEDDILRVNEQGRMTFKRKVLTEEQEEIIKADAVRFKESQIWYFLRQEVKFQASQRLILKSVTPQDIVASKVLVYLLKVMTDKVNSLAKQYIYSIIKRTCQGCSNGVSVERLNATSQDVTAPLSPRLSPCGVLFNTHGIYTPMLTSLKDV